MQIQSTTQSSTNITIQKNNETIDQFHLSKNKIEKIFKNDKENLTKAIILKELSSKTNDDIFNKVLFNSAKDMNINEIQILSSILDDSSSIDRFSGILLSPDKLSEISSNPNTISNKKLSLNSYKDTYEFINSTIEHLEQSYKNNKFMEHPKEAFISDKFHKLFLDIETNYVDIIDNDQTLLSEYTRTIKPLILEEQEQIEENKQLQIAMDIYSLDTSSIGDKFEFELIQEGYTQYEAQERRNLYSQAGLLGHSDIENKFGITVYDLSMLGQSPKLKNSMMQSYSQMDTKTLHKVVNRVNSFPRSIDEMNDILGKEGQYTPEEIIQRSNDYWDNKYGTTEQINNHFLKEIAQIALEQKFTSEDLSYIKDGIQLLIDIFNKKV